MDPRNSATMVATQSPLVVISFHKGLPAHVMLTLRRYCATFDEALPKNPLLRQETYSRSAMRIVVALDLIPAPVSVRRGGSCEDDSSSARQFGARGASAPIR